VKIDLARVQRSGVRTEKAESRVLVQPVHAVGAIAIDEARLTVVAMRSEGYVEDLFVNTTGQKVRAGEPLFRVYSADIQKAQTDYIVAIKAAGRNVAGFDTGQTVAGAELRLRNLGVPETRIREIRETGVNARVLDWPSPATGTVISKRIVNGQRVAPGDELYRIADLSHVWVIADVAEADIGEIRPGTRATVTLRAFRSQPIEGIVTFIYPELRTETRTARVRIEVANSDERLRTDMYADVVFHIEGAGSATTVPIDAVVDSGSRQIVLVAKGDGQFEPRRVKAGRRDAHRVEILEGLAPGDEVVSSATFLIDAESNLQTALKAFRNAEPVK
jgi:Cu(I)/Ag(I) efflux system membrane fusion protein